MSNTELSRDLLEHALSMLTETKEQTGRCDGLVAQKAGEVSLLLGFQDLADRFTTFLTDADRHASRSEAITDLQADRTVAPPRARTLASLPKIMEHYPIFTPEYAGTILSSAMGEHLEPCRTRDYETGFKLTGSNEFVGHEIILAQAINGDYSLAEKSLERLVQPELRDDIYRVLAIEYFRHDDQPNGHRNYTLLKQNGGVDAWSAIHLAIGVSNRVPWLCYPFSDY